MSLASRVVYSAHRRLVFSAVGGRKGPSVSAAGLDVFLPQRVFFGRSFLRPKKPRLGRSEVKRSCYCVQSAPSVRVRICFQVSRLRCHPVLTFVTRSYARCTVWSTVTLDDVSLVPRPCYDRSRRKLLNLLNQSSSNRIHMFVSAVSFSQLFFRSLRADGLTSQTLPDIRRCGPVVTNLFLSGWLQNETVPSGSALGRSSQGDRCPCAVYG